MEKPQGCLELAGLAERHFVGFFFFRKPGSLGTVCQTLGFQKRRICNFLKGIFTPHRVSHVRCHVSLVMCHMVGVIHIYKYIYSLISFKSYMYIYIDSYRRLVCRSVSPLVIFVKKWLLEYQNLPSYLPMGQLWQ